MGYHGYMAQRKTKNWCNQVLQAFPKTVPSDQKKEGQVMAPKKKMPKGGNASFNRKFNGKEYRWWGTSSNKTTAQMVADGLKTKYYVRIVPGTVIVNYKKIHCKIIYIREKPKSRQKRRAR